MDLYLVQHGEAKSETEDPERSLTERGRREVEQVAAWTARACLQVAQIRHSGKRRAEQTAAILAERLVPPEGMVPVSGLAPNDDVNPVAEALRAETRPLMLVGHLPFLSRLASLFLVGNLSPTIIRFRMGGIVCLAREEERWAVAWVITPGLTA